MKETGIIKVEPQTLVVSKLALEALEERLALYIVDYEIDNPGIEIGKIEYNRVSGVVNIEAKI